MRINTSVKNPDKSLQFKHLSIGDYFVFTSERPPKAWRKTSSDHAMSLDSGAMSTVVPLDSPVRQITELNVEIVL